MRDLFDEFMEELRRREAIGRGEDPDRGAPRRVSPDEPPDDPTDDDDDDAPRSSDSDDEKDGRVPPPRRPRVVGGANDGERVIGGGPSGRQVVLIAFVAILIGLFLVSSTLLDLSTDALWFHSVGFDSVFWTRIGAQAALFVGALVAGLVVLLGNLWLAGRLGPPAGTGGGAIRSIVGRLNDAAEAAAANQGRRDPRYGGRRQDEPRAPESFAIVRIFIAKAAIMGTGSAPDARACRRRPSASP